MKAGLVLAVLIALAGVVWMLLVAGPDNRHILISDAVAKPLDGVSADGSADVSAGVGESDGGMAAAVLTIENRGGPDRLVAVTGRALGDGAEAGVSLYDPLATDGLPVPVGRSSLALDGAHIRVADPQEALQDGSLIPLTLTFAQAGDVSVRARLSDPAKTGAAPTVGLFGFGDICRVEEGEPAPEIKLDVQQDGDGWRVRVVSAEFEFSKDLLGLYHVPGLGHGHIYVGGMKLGRMLTPDFHIGALPTGRHEVRVTLNTNDHRAYVVDGFPVTASAEIIVD